MKALLINIILLAFLGYGWILNLLALINMEVWVWSAKTLIGIGGVFVPPIGVIMGYFIW